MVHTGTIMWDKRQVETGGGSCCMMYNHRTYNVIIKVPNDTVFSKCTCTRNVGLHNISHKISVGFGCTFVVVVVIILWWYKQPSYTSGLFYCHRSNHVITIFSRNIFEIVVCIISINLLRRSWAPLSYSLNDLSHRIFLIQRVHNILTFPIEHDNCGICWSYVPKHTLHFPFSEHWVIVILQYQSIQWYWVRTPFFAIFLSETSQMTWSQNQITIVAHYSAAINFGAWIP